MNNSKIGIVSLILFCVVFIGSAIAVNHVDNEPGMSFKSPAHEMMLEADKSKYSAYSENEIKHAQKSLQSLGLYSGQLDGIMGPQTSHALLRYQTENDLNGSGKLDETTFESLSIRLDNLRNKNRAGEIYSE